MQRPHCEASAHVLTEAFPSFPAVADVPDPDDTSAVLLQHRNSLFSRAPHEHSSSAFQIQWKHTK